MEFVLAWGYPQIEFGYFRKIEDQGIAMGAAFLVDR